MEILPDGRKRLNWDEMGKALLKDAQKRASKKYRKNMTNRARIRRIQKKASEKRKQKLFLKKQEEHPEEALVKRKFWVSV